MRPNADNEILKEDNSIPCERKKSKRDQKATIDADLRKKARQLITTTKQRTRTSLILSHFFSFVRVELGMARSPNGGGGNRTPVLIQSLQEPLYLHASPLEFQVRLRVPHKVLTCFSYAHGTCEWSRLSLVRVPILRVRLSGSSNSFSPIFRRREQGDADEQRALRKRICSCYWQLLFGHIFKGA